MDQTNELDRIIHRTHNMTNSTNWGKLGHGKHTHTKKQGYI